MIQYIIPSQSSTNHIQLKQLNPMTAPDMFQCPKCDEKFHFERYLNLHSRQIHDRLPVHHCPHCRNAFGTVKDVNDHIQKVHDGEQRPYSCQLCTCSFLSQLTLRQHINDLHCRPSKKCSDCDFETVHDGVMNQHMQDKHDKEFLSPPLDMSYQAAERRTVGFLSLDFDNPLDHEASQDI